MNGRGTHGRSAWRKAVALSVPAALLALAQACYGGGDGGGDADAGEVTEFSAVTFLPQTAEYYVEGMGEFMDTVNEELEGEVQIDYLGGPDVIPGFDQFEAVRNGTVDLAAIPANYAAGALSIAPAIELSRLSPIEEREAGVYDIWRDIYEEELDLVYLGNISTAPHHLWTNFEVDSLDDFEGKVMRSAPIQRPLIEVLGAEAVSMEGGEIFTAMERGVIGGFAWPAFGIVDLGLNEVTDYRIDPGFGQSAVPIVMNVEAFETLSEENRAALEEIAREVEREMYEQTQERLGKMESTLEEQDVQIIKLPPDEADALTKLAYESGWQRLMETADPERVEELRELTTPEGQ